MIERLIESHDLKKIHAGSSLKHKLSDILNKTDFVEIVDDKHLMLGLRQKSGNEVLQIADNHLLDFMRKVRDDMNVWKEMVNVRRTAHRQLLANLHKSQLFEFLSLRFDKNMLNDSMKMSKRIMDYNKKIEILHDRLQGVFIVNNKKKDVVNSFDNKNTVIVSKISNGDANELCWTKEAKYATLVVICPDDNFIHKYLKTNGLEKLIVDKKKCKNIWVKNHK